MKRLFLLSVSMFVSIILLTSCSVTIKVPETFVTRMDVKLPVSSRIVHSDSHDNFFGEGELYEEYKLERYYGEHIYREISGDPNWQKMPIDEFIVSLLSDFDNIAFSRSAGQDIENREIIIPQSINGYYCFYDKRANSYSPQDFSSSYNSLDYGYCIAAIDLENYTFYYFEMDR